MRIEAERLMRQAERDLENARKTLEHIRAYELVAFLCHQSVEKFLKAYWIDARSEHAPRTHSLIELAVGLEVPEALVARLRTMNPDYTLSRDPVAANAVPYEAYDRAMAESRVAIASDAQAWLRERIGG